MTILATRIRELSDLEGFDVEVLDPTGKPVDIKQNGLPKYNFEKKANGTMTVADWKAKRFQKVYRRLDCRVLYDDGREAKGNAKLKTVRASYEEQ